MRVLVVCVPAAGHVNPVMPLVDALVSQGDEVVVAAGEDPGGVVARSGARFQRAGHGEMDWFGVLRDRTRGAPGDGLPPGRINHYFLPRLFGEIATADMIDDVVSCGRELDPDVLVFETYALAGPLAADVLGVPAVHHLISPMLPHDVFELVNDAVSPIWRSLGREAPEYAGVYGGVSIEVTPPSLEAQLVPSGESISMRGVELPQREPTPSKPPLVYATLGTAFGNVDVFRAILDAIAGREVEVVVTVGTGIDPSAVGAVPRNARVEQFLPQADVMPGCSAVIHHGGSGTMFGSLAHGLPQVILPQGADNFLNGDLVARAGAGRTLGPEDVSAAAIGSALEAVLDDPSYAGAAGRIAAEIAAQSPPDDVARALRTRFAS